MRTLFLKIKLFFWRFRNFQELEKSEQQILVEKSQIKSQVDTINGEIAAYNKIEPPVTEVEPTKASETELKSVR